MLIDIIFICLDVLFAYLVYKLTDSYAMGFLCLIAGLLLTPIAGLFYLLIEYFVKNGSVYDGSGSYVNDIVVDSYTTNSAIIAIYPALWSGHSMKFKVDRSSGTISSIN